MGMDGLSMSNTGMLKEATSLDYSKESEELSKEDTEKSMIVQELTQQERVNEEKEENRKRRKANKENANEDSEAEEQQDAEPETVDESGDSINPEDLLLVDGENKGFYTKLSKNLENIELYDRITDRLIGTITPEELSYLISKLNMGTGIFINKKV